MKTIVLETPGKLIRTDTPWPPSPRDGEVLVRVRRVGICGTDLHAFRGRQPFFSYPRVLGHELGVEVVETGSGGSGLTPGDRCAVEPYLNCGFCIACRRGRTNCCVRLQVLGVHTDGGMREHILVPAAKLHRSAQLSLEQLALVETLGIGAHAVGRAQLEPNEWVLVVGAGPIGLAVTQFAEAAGARIIVLDVNQRRLAFCQQRYRIAQAVLADDHSLAQIEALTDGDLPTAVFDATGSAPSMQSSFRYVAHGGRLVLVGIVTGDITFHDPEFHRRELTLLASRNATACDFQRIIAMIEAGRIDTTSWITHRADIDHVAEQFPGWLTPEAGVIKAMMEVT